MQAGKVPRWVVAATTLFGVLGVGFIGYSIAGFLDPIDYPGEIANLLLIAAAGALEIVAAVWMWRVALRRRD